MKTLLLTLLLVTNLPLTNAWAQGRDLPDLQISQVREKNKTATILIRNHGTQASTPCVLRVYALTNTGWVVRGQITVGVVHACCTLFVSITANGIEQNPTLYKVDALNQVAELNENNNGKVVP